MPVRAPGQAKSWFEVRLQIPINSRLATVQPGTCYGRGLAGLRFSRRRAGHPRGEDGIGKTVGRPVDRRPNAVRCECPGAPDPWRVLVLCGEWLGASAQKSDAKRGGVLVGPSEYSGALLVASRYRLADVLSEFAARSEFRDRRSTTVVWFRSPALPLAVSPAVRFSLGDPRGSQLSNPCTLSSSSAFLQSIAQRSLADPPQRVDSSHGLSRPFSTRRLRGPLPRGLPHPATFRPQGLVTLSAAYSLRAPAGSFSHRRRSWDFALRSFLLSAGIRRVSGRKNPHAVSPVGIPGHRGDWAGPTGRGSWASALPGVPGGQRMISAPTAGCSLGLHPFQGILAAA